MRTIVRLRLGLDGKEARWRVLGLVCLAIVLSMTTWFSATAITPELVALRR